MGAGEVKEKHGARKLKGYIKRKMSNKDESSSESSESEEENEVEISSKVDASSKSSLNSTSDSESSTDVSSKSSDDSRSSCEEVIYSSTLENLSSREKIKKMDNEISTLRHQLDFYKTLNELNNNGSTKKGRQLQRLGSNRSIMTSIRDVMADIIFPHCKFIGKMDLQSTAKGSIADVLMKKLKVGKKLKGGDNHEWIKHRLEWWGANCELVEKCLVDHKTKTTQNLKKKYLSGKSWLCILKFGIYQLNSTIVFLFKELFKRTNDRGTEWSNEIMKIMENHDIFNKDSMFAVLEDEKKYASFVTFCASCIVGSQKYKGCVSNGMDDDDSNCANWFTPDDEAMSWLILENSVKKWNREYQLKKEKMEKTTRNYLGFQSIKLSKDEKKSLPATKYTERRTSTDSKKLSGWDHIGVARFKDLKREIMKFRYTTKVDVKGKVTIVLDSNGEKCLTNEYQDYAFEATKMMREKLKLDSPDPKKRSLEMCKSEQTKKKLIHDLYCDPELSMFSNVSGRVVAL